MKNPLNYAVDKQQTSAKEGMEWPIISTENWCAIDHEVGIYR